MEQTGLTVSEFLAVVNQTLTGVYEATTIVGEVMSFKVNQGKWVFFDLKDEESSLSCFLPVFQLRVPIEDGMKVVVRGVPKVTKWGKFSFTVQQVMPVGEGSIKKSFELLKRKLTEEGLFDRQKKRTIVRPLNTLGVISSTQAAGYADFIKIMNERWGGMKIEVAHTGVQGMAAADQIIRALDYFNEKGEVEAIAIIRGGGSKDDLMVFNDEKLVRAVAASRIPVITGIGHEVDESLADLAADVTASTPSNAAQFLTPEKGAELRRIHDKMRTVMTKILEEKIKEKRRIKEQIELVRRGLFEKIRNGQERLTQVRKIIKGLDPEIVLARGYAIMRGEVEVGNVVEITTFERKIEARVLKTEKRRKKCQE